MERERERERSDGARARGERARARRERERVLRGWRGPSKWRVVVVARARRLRASVARPETTACRRPAQRRTAARHPRWRPAHPLRRRRARRAADAAAKRSTATTSLGNARFWNSVDRDTWTTTGSREGASCRAAVAHLLSMSVTPFAPPSESTALRSNSSISRKSESPEYLRERASSREEKTTKSRRWFRRRRQRQL